MKEPKNMLVIPRFFSELQTSTSTLRKRVTEILLKLKSMFIFPVPLNYKNVAFPVWSVFSSCLHPKPVTLSKEKKLPEKAWNTLTLS